MEKSCLLARLVTTFCPLSPSIQRWCGDLDLRTARKKRSMIAQGMPFFALFPPFFPNGPLCSYSNRCLRHFAIYHQPWPRRVSAHRGTPREESTPASDASKRVTHKSLPVLDHKLAAAVSASKRTHKEDSPQEELASKRRKTDSLPSVVVKVKLPTTAALRPSTSSAPPPASGVPSETPVPVVPESGRRTRGRPRLSDKPVNNPSCSSSSPSRLTIVKVEETPVDLPPKSNVSQPRNTNGRFGRKDALFKAQQRAAKSAREGTPPSRKERSEPSKPTRFSLRRKRANDEMDERLRKKPLFQPPVQKVLPRRIPAFRGASLVSNPNPLRFALQVWANPVLCNEGEEEEPVLSSSEEDDQGPETPDDQLSPPANMVDLDHETLRDVPVSSVDVKATILPRAPLTYKPSPFTFAKRRWASSGLGPVDTNAKRQGGLGERTGRRVPGSGVGGGGGGGGGGDDDDEVCS